MIIPERESLALDFIHRNNTLCWVSHFDGNKGVLSFNPYTQYSNSIPSDTYKQDSRPQSKLICTDISNSSTTHDVTNKKFNTWSMPQPDMFDLKSISHVAVDWTTRNWYFLDDTRELVLLCGLRYEPQVQYLCKMVL